MHIMVYVVHYIIDYVFGQIIFSFQVILINKVMFQSVDGDDNNGNKQSLNYGSRILRP